VIEGEKITLDVLLGLAVPVVEIEGDVGPGISPVAAELDVPVIGTRPEDTRLYG